MADELDPTEGFCKNVSPIVFGVHSGDLQFTVGHLLPDDVVPKANVLGPLCQFSLIAVRDRFSSLIIAI